LLNSKGPAALASVSTWLRDEEASPEIVSYGLSSGQQQVPDHVRQAADLNRCLGDGRDLVGAVQYDGLRLVQEHDRAERGGRGPVASCWCRLAGRQKTAALRLAASSRGKAPDDDRIGR
jgi:hypothetical protein